MAACAVTQQVGNLFNFIQDFLAVVPVHHGEQVIGPVRQVPGALVAVADAVQPANLFTHYSNNLVGDIPD